MAARKTPVKKVVPKKKTTGKRQKPEGSGKQAHVPTEQTRTIVYLLKGVGFSAEKIMPAIGIASKETLYKYYREEMEQARGKWGALIANELHKKIKAGDTTCILFASKTVLGLRETGPIDDQAQSGGITIQLIQSDSPERERNK
jgi:hypothetical protein